MYYKIPQKDFLWYFHLIGSPLKYHYERGQLLQKAAPAVLQNATSSKDMEVYGNLKTQAAKIKQLDKPDPVRVKQIDEKPVKVYDLDPAAVGLDAANRNTLGRQIDNMDLPEREKVRLKRDANIEDIDFEEMLDDTEEKTKHYE